MFSALKEMPEVQKYIKACNFVFNRMEDSSIVSSSIIAAIEGHFGDYHSSARTMSSKLFINALMAQFWCFKLTNVAESVHYLAQLSETKSAAMILKAIDEYRSGLGSKIRPKVDFPH